MIFISTVPYISVLSLLKPLDWIKPDLLSDLHKRSIRLAQLYSWDGEVPGWRLTGGTVLYPWAEHHTLSSGHYSFNLLGNMPTWLKYCWQGCKASTQSKQVGSARAHLVLACGGVKSYQLHDSSFFYYALFICRSKQNLKVREHNILGPYVDGLSMLVVASFEVRTAMTTFIIVERG